MIIISVYLIAFRLSGVKPKQNNDNGQSEQREIFQRANENSRQIQVNGVKRGETRATEKRLVLVLHRI